MAKECTHQSSYDYIQQRRSMRTQETTEAQNTDQRFSKLVKGEISFSFYMMNRVNRANTPFAQDRYNPTYRPHISINIALKEKKSTYSSP